MPTGNTAFHATANGGSPTGGDLPHRPKSQAHGIGSRLVRVDRIGGQPELGRKRPKMKPAALQVWRDQTKREVSGAAALQDVLQPQPADVGDHACASILRK